MSANRRKNISLLVILGAALLVLLSATTASAAISTKLQLGAELGFEVNKTTKGNFCTVSPGDECEVTGGAESQGPAGFNEDLSVATDPNTGNIYVADNNHQRVQEFNAGGEFVLMFGWKVNKTTGGNVCSEGEVKAGDECQEGEAGTGLAGQLYGDQDVAVDPGTGNVYVLELYYKRIEEFTSSGEFVLVIGGEVNKTKVEKGGSEAEQNVCTAASGDTCQAGEFAPTGPGRGAFREYPLQFSGDLLSIGGPDHLLYLADQGRIQELSVTGEWKGEISLAAVSATAKPEAIAANAAGDVYLSAISFVSPYGQIGGIHELDSKGVEIPGFAQSEAGKTEAEVEALAVDPATGRLAAQENVGSSPHGALYDENGTALSNFAPQGGSFSHGITFNTSDELYIAEDSRRDVEIFKPAEVPEAVTKSCKNVTTTTVVLTGEVNPKEVAETAAWFEYGTSGAFGAKTKPESVTPGSVSVPVEAAVEGLLPNETYVYRLEAEGKTDPGEPGEGKTLSCSTKLAPAAIDGEPEAADITYSSVALFAGLNPENADTDYFFEYAPNPFTAYSGCKELEEEAGNCPSRTADLRSSADSPIDVALGVGELQPSTTYHYRLVAINHSKDLKEESRVDGIEGAFATSAAPHPTATTGQAGAVTTTTATLNGSVDPGGAGATFAFEVGVYNGASTVYSTVVQGSTGSRAASIPESFTLRGLLPGVTYAFRISLSSAYEPNGQLVLSAPQLFTTSSLPVVVGEPVVLPMLEVPKIAFPRTAKQPTNAQKLAKALKACKKDRKKQRKACERDARKRYRTPSKKSSSSKRK